VLDERGVERCVLVGSSMGAATAMAFALAQPGRVEALVQITPAYDGEARTGSSSLEVWDARADAMAAGDIDAFVRLTGVDDLPERMRDAARTAVRQRAGRHEHPEAVAEALRQVPRSAAFDGLEQLASVEMPVLVVGSRDDADPEHPLAIAREYAALLPDAQLVVEDEGQPPLAWQGARLSKAIAEFLGSYS
jgi:pimeloyl-ACP methyl ester carboxylesterase